MRYVLDAHRCDAACESAIEGVRHGPKIASADRSTSDRRLCNDFIEYLPAAGPSGQCGCSRGSVCSATKPTGGRSHRLVADVSPRGDRHGSRAPRSIISTRCDLQRRYHHYGRTAHHAASTGRGDVHVLDARGRGPERPGRVPQMRHEASEEAEQRRTRPARGRTP